MRDAEDELQIVIVKDMMLTGFDAPPLHTLYLDRPLKGALLMQTLARVNRTFRGKPAGLLVAYAPLVENLNQALAEYTETDRDIKPVGKNIDEAVALTETLVVQLDEVCAGYAWRSKIDTSPQAWMKAAVGLTNYLRSPNTPGNQVGEGEQTLAERFRKLANPLARAWALCAGNETLDVLRPTVKFYEQVRVWMGKFDAQERQADGKPIPEDIKRLLSALVAESTASGEIVDIYEAAGLPKPSLSDLSPDYEAKAKAAANPHLAIEALRAVLTKESGERHGQQRGAAAGILRADRGTHAALHQRTAHLRRGDRRTNPDGERGCRRGQSGFALHARRCPATNSRSTMPCRPTNRLSSCRAKTCSPRSPGSWSA